MVKNAHLMRSRRSWLQPVIAASMLLSLPGCSTVCGSWCARQPLPDGLCRPPEAAMAAREEPPAPRAGATWADALAWAVDLRAWGREAEADKAAIRQACGLL